MATVAQLIVLLQEYPPDTIITTNVQNKGATLLIPIKDGELLLRTIPSPIQVKENIRKAAEQLSDF